MIIGFNAYIFCIMTKVFFNQKKYDILKRKVNKEKFYNKWNICRAKSDGIYYRKIEEFLPQQRIKFIRIFSYYYLKNPYFYIKDILDDEFRLYKYNEYQLLHIKEGFKSDFRFILNFAAKNKKTLKDVFRNKKIPIIFKLYDLGKISIYSLIIFNEIFNLLKNVNYEKFDVLEKERYLFYNEKIFNKFKFVVKNILFDEKYDWVKIMKEI